MLLKQYGGGDCGIHVIHNIVTIAEVNYNNYVYKCYVDNSLCLMQNAENLLNGTITLERFAVDASCLRKSIRKSNREQISSSFKVYL